MATPPVRGGCEFRCFDLRTINSENSKIAKYFQKPRDFLQFEGIRQPEEYLIIRKLAGETGKMGATCASGIISLVNFGDSGNAGCRDLFVRLIRSLRRDELDRSHQSRGQRLVLCGAGGGETRSVDLHQSGIVVVGETI